MKALASLAPSVHLSLLLDLGWIEPSRYRTLGLCFFVRLLHYSHRTVMCYPHRFSLSFHWPFRQAKPAHDCCSNSFFAILREVAVRLAGLDQQQRSASRFDSAFLNEFSKRPSDIVQGVIAPAPLQATTLNNPAARR